MYRGIYRVPKIAKILTRTRRDAVRGTYNIPGIYINIIYIYIYRLRAFFYLNYGTSRIGAAVIRYIEQRAVLVLRS